MVFGIFSRKLDRARIYQDIRRVEQHFQNTILGAEPPIENIIEEFDLVLEQIPPERSPAMLEPLLRLDELSTGIVSSFYASRICSRLRGNLRRAVRSEELLLYDKVCAKHLEFLGELETVFYPEIIRSKRLQTVVTNRQFHWLCELGKMSCLKGGASADAHFALADDIMATGEEYGIADDLVCPYPGLYPEERASLARNKVRLYLLASFRNSDLPGSDIDVANTLWRITPFEHARFSERRTAEATHFIAHEGKAGGCGLQRIYPELDEGGVRLWFCGLRLAGEMREMAANAERIVQETSLGRLFSQVISDKSIERVALFLSASQSRENKRMPVRMGTEGFAEIIDCICYLRRANEDFLIALSDVDEKRKFHIHEQFEEMNFGYVDGHVNRTTRNVVNESIAKSLLRKLDAEYAHCGIEPAQWRIEDVSTTGYGLVLPAGVRPPEISSIVILSREDDEGIEFGVVRRHVADPEKSLLGVELLFPGCDVDPFFLLKCEDHGIPIPGQLSDPYGFLLTEGGATEGNDSSVPVLLMSKKTRIPQRCTLRIKTLGEVMEGQVTGVLCEGCNWIAYRWKGT